MSVHYDRSYQYWSIEKSRVHKPLKWRGRQADLIFAGHMQVLFNISVEFYRFSNTFSCYFISLWEATTGFSFFLQKINLTNQKRQGTKYRWAIFAAPIDWDQSVWPTHCCLHRTSSGSLIDWRDMGVPLHSQYSKHSTKLHENTKKKKKIRHVLAVDEEEKWEKFPLFCHEDIMWALKRISFEAIPRRPTTYILMEKKVLSLTSNMILNWNFMLLTDNTCTSSTSHFTSFHFLNTMGTFAKECNLWQCSS